MVMMTRVTMGMRVMALLPRRSLATGTAGKQTLCSRWSSTTSGQSWSSTTSGQSWKQRREHWIKLKLKAGCLESCCPVVFQETFLSFHNMPMLRCSPAWKQKVFCPVIFLKVLFSYSQKFQNTSYAVSSGGGLLCTFLPSGQMIQIISVSFVSFSLERFSGTSRTKKENKKSDIFNLGLMFMTCTGDKKKVSRPNLGKTG